MDIYKVKKLRNAGASSKMFAAKVFEPLKALIKDWSGFLRTVEDMIKAILEEEEYKTNIDITSEVETTVYGKQIGGYQPGMPPSGAGLDPPEYAETYVDVPDEVRIHGSIKIKYMDLVRDWTSSLRSDLNDPKEFQKDFFIKLSKDRTFKKLFIKLIHTVLMQEVKTIDADTWADIADLEAYLKKEMDDTPDIIDVTRVKAKLTNISDTSSYFEVFFEVNVDLEIEIEEDEGMGKYAAKWDSLPKGWTQESLKKFWSSLTGDRKHKVTACIKKMEGKIDNPGAFCASLNDKIDPGWRTKKKANRLATQWVMKQAQEPVTFNHFLKPLAKLPSMILRDLMALNQKSSFSDVQSYKTYICGFIYVMLSELQLKKSSQVQQVWNLFERSGPSMSYGKDTQNLYRKYARFFRGPGSEPWLKATAVAIDLLRRGRLPSVMVKFEALMIRDLADELAGTTPASGKLETATQTLTRLVKNEMPSAKGLLLAVGKNPKTIRAYVADIFEDVNWSSLAGQLWVEPDEEIKHDIVSKITMDYNWSFEPVALFGLAALSLVKDRTGISIIKKALKRGNPDYLKENAELI